MNPRSSSAVAESKALRRTSPQSGRSPQAERQTYNLPVTLRRSIIANDADLCRGINLCLPNVLPLAQNGSSHQLVPVLFADEVRSLEKDGCAIAPRHSLPPGPCGQGALDCPRNS